MAEIFSINALNLQKHYKIMSVHRLIESSGGYEWEYIWKH